MSKYIIQIGIILLVSYLGNWVHSILNTSLPGSIIGMLLLLIFLMTGIIKLSMIEDVSNFMLKHLSFFFIPAAVGIITCFPVLHGKWGPLLFISITSTIIVALVTGLTVQLLIKRKVVKEKCHDHDN